MIHIHPQLIEPSFFLRPTELVTNGEFASSIDDWTNATTGAVGGGTPAYNSGGNGRLRLNDAAVSQAISTVKNKNKTTNRQNFKNKFYIIDGSMYLSKVSFLKKYKSFVKPNITKLFKSSVTPMVDINIMLDLKVAEILRKKVYKY